MLGLGHIRFSLIRHWVLSEILSFGAQFLEAESFDVQSFKVQLFKPQTFKVKSFDVQSVNPQV
jgi:hypothetical protein